MAKAQREKPTNNPVVTLGEVLERSNGRLTELPAADDDYGEIDEREERIDNDIESVLTQIGAESDDAEMAVYLVDPDKKKPDAYCFKTTPAEFSLDRIALDYGGGLYRIRGWKKRSPGLRGIDTFMNRIVAVKDPPAALKKAHEIKQTSEVDGVTKAIEAMGTNMEKAMAMMATAIAAMAAPKPTNEMDMFDKLLKMKQLLMPDTAPRQEKDTLSEIDRYLSMKTKLDALGGSGESSHFALMAELAKPVLEAVKAQAETKRAELQRQPLLPNPTPEPIAQESSTQPGGIEMNMMIGVILNAAKNDSDPVSYANLILDAMPEHMVGQFVDDPQWFEKLCIAAPDCKQYEPWFREVHQEMLILLTPEADSDNDVDNSTVENPHASGKTG